MMTNIAPTDLNTFGTGGFFRTLAVVMAITIVAGFSLQFMRGFSSLSARPLVHVHGIAFMGWVGLFVAQSVLATRGSVALHRTLGWIGAFWVIILVVLGVWISIDVVQRGIAPFFFQPQHFLIGNPLSAIVFAVLVFSAIWLRRRTDWHIRLQICALTAIMGPAFGRLLPMPLLIPCAFESAGIAGMIFAIAGMVRDRRLHGKVHPAWYWGLGAVIAVMPITWLLAGSAVGDALYAYITTGHPGQHVPGMAYPAPPPMPSAS